MNRALCFLDLTKPFDAAYQVKKQNLATGEITHLGTNILLTRKEDHSQRLCSYQGNVANVSYFSTPDVDI